MSTLSQALRLRISTESENEEVAQPTVGLFGTIQSTWREQFIPTLQINHYNPVVEEWSMESQQQEEAAKATNDFNLYVITPKQQGFYAFAEMTASAIRNPEKTVITILEDDDGAVYEEHQASSIEAVKRLLADTGVKIFDTLADTTQYLNDQKKA